VTAALDPEDRLALGRRLGYACGTSSEPPPRAGAWFTKPIRNPPGMGVGARRNRYRSAPRAGWADALAAGDMWMPLFRGAHYSVDFRRERGRWRQRLTVRCIPARAAARPALWRVESVAFEVPAPLRHVDSEWLNVELIGGAVIEAHLRRNTDFDRAPPGARVAHVVWADQRPPAGMVGDFDDADGQLSVPRLGFVYR
jgi:hypothetical protein